MLKFLKNLLKLRKFETEEDISKRIESLTKDVDCGIFAKPMDAQVAVYELARHLLGEDWYITYSCSNEQANTEIVYAIETKYKNKIKE